MTFSKVFAVSVLCVFLCSFSVAQEAYFTKVFEGISYFDHFTAIRSLSDGGFVAAATYGVNELYLYQSVLLRFDSSGKVLWQKRADIAFVRSIVQGPNSDITITGINETCPFSRTCYGTPAIARFNVSGKLLWSRTFDSPTFTDVFPDTSCCYDSVATRDNGVMVLGYDNDAGLYGPLLIKLTHSGDIQWSRRFSLPGFSFRPEQIVAGCNDEVYVLGALGDSVLVLKVDQQGKAIWSRRFELKDSGGLYLTGSVLASDVCGVYVSLYQSGKEASVLLKIGNDGKLMWRRGVADYVSAITANNGILTAGHLLVKIDPGGSVQWARKQPDYRLNAIERVGQGYVISADRELGGALTKVELSGVDPTCHRYPLEPVALTRPVVKIANVTLERTAISLKTRNLPFKLYAWSSQIAGCQN